MQLAVLLGLAALWVAVLLPDFLRRRHTHRSADSISSFSRHLSVLERANPVMSGGRSSLRPSGIRRPSSNVIPFAPRRQTAPTPEATYAAASTTSTTSAAAVARPAPSRPRPAPAPARTTQRPPARPAPLGTAPASRAEVHRRRQDVIVALGAGALLSFLGTLAFGGAMLAVHLVIDVALLGYLALVLRATRRDHARAEVTYLAPREPGMVTAPVPTRSTAAR